MAGLPATGKSTIAARLGKELNAVVLDKDKVRALLFPPPVLNYSRQQDDICMTAIYNAAASILTSLPGRVVILDGRTFLQWYQVEDFFALAASVDEVPRIIECVCADEVAGERLEKNHVLGAHLAGNRSFALYQALKATAEPLRVPRLILDTGKVHLTECVDRCLAYLKSN
jgi:predicted kinase